MSTGTDTSKYDRQLRLWGPIAQARLEGTKLLSIGSDCVTTESLKSVVLPGIGFIGIADNHVISEVDLETNFFVDLEDKDKKRGEITLKNLLELNDRVKGEFYDKSFEQILEDIEFIKQFDVIICPNQKHDNIVKLTQLTKVPVFEIITNGYLGFIKIYLGSHVVFDNGNTNINMDLRISHPFPKLQEMYDKIDLPKLDKEDHSHVPFPIILIWALNQWRKETNNLNGIPTKKEEKERIKEIIKGEARNYYADENFQEAVQYSFYCWLEPFRDVKKLIDDKRINETLKGKTKEQIEFWAFISSVKEFYEKTKRFPVDSSIKDMIAGTKYFVQLQHAFNDQLESDAAEILKTIEQRLEKDGVKDVVKFDIDSVKRYCKALRKMYVVDGADGTENKSWANDADLFDYREALITYLALFYGSMDFQKANGRIPEDAKDVQELKSKTEEFLKTRGVNKQINEKYVQEICRFGGVQIHTVNSVIGSIVGQEIIKCSTHQFGLMDNTFLFDTQTGDSLVGKF